MPDLDFIIDVAGLERELTDCINEEADNRQCITFDKEDIKFNFEYIDDDDN